MTGAQEVTCRPLHGYALWLSAGLGATGTGTAAVSLTYRERLLDLGPLGIGLLFTLVGAGLLLALLGSVSLYWSSARVSAGAYGLRSRTLLRRRSVPWRDIADLQVRLQHERNHRVPTARRVGLVLHDGRKRLLPLPRTWSSEDDPDFDAKLDSLLALHRRYGTPKSAHVPVVTYRTAGRGAAGWLFLCVLLLAGAGLAAWFVPHAASEEQAWKAATPCTAETPATERGECLSSMQAVIEQTDANRTKRRSWLYFAGSRPLERLAVPQEAAQRFRPGDSVELTVWRRQVMRVAGERYVWREHVTPAGDVSTIAAACVLAAGYPGAKVLLRLRGRRLPDDEILPSALPFAGALVGTALWLLPLSHLHPTTLPATPERVTWTAAGSLISLVLFAWAWRATRVRTPGKTGTTGESAENKQKDVFLSARFLDHTDYNPYGFGTHIVLGDGPLAVTPGPDRFAAKRIPVERLTVTDVRRVRGGDGDTVSRSWHVAELDDAGRPVRLAAAPADLARIIRELRPATAPGTTTPPEP